jgi:hypothetical protein
MLIQYDYDSEPEEDGIEKDEIERTKEQLYENSKNEKD